MRCVRRGRCSYFCFLSTHCQALLVLWNSRAPGRHQSGSVVCTTLPAAEQPVVVQCSPLTFRMNDQALLSTIRSGCKVGHLRRLSSVVSWTTSALPSIADRPAPIRLIEWSGQMAKSGSSAMSIFPKTLQIKSRPSPLPPIQQLRFPGLFDPFAALSAPVALATFLYLKKSRRDVILQPDVSFLPVSSPAETAVLSCKRRLPLLQGRVPVRPSGLDYWLRRANHAAEP